MAHSLQRSDRRLPGAHRVSRSKRLSQARHRAADGFARCGGRDACTDSAATGRGLRAGRATKTRTRGRRHAAGWRVVGAGHIRREWRCHGGHGRRPCRNGRRDSGARAHTRRGRQRIRARRVAEQHDAQRAVISRSLPPAQRQHEHALHNIDVRCGARWIRRRGNSRDVESGQHLHAAKRQPHPRRAGASGNRPHQSPPRVSPLRTRRGRGGDGQTRR